MRWNGLFEDLEAQASALDVAGRAAEIDERTRGEIGGLRLRDRLDAATGAPVRLRLAGGLAVAGTVERVGADWVMVLERTGGEIVVAMGAVMTVRDLGRAVAVAGTRSVVGERLGLRSVLRAVARDRSAVRVHLVNGHVVDATVDRVAGDYLEVAAHAAAEARRRRDVREVELMPLAAVAAVRRVG